jgi:hypothetical protein
MKERGFANFAPRRKVPRLLAKVLALTAIAMTVAAGSAEAKSYADLHQSAPLPAKLRPLRSLPGFKKSVNVKQFEELEGSAVKVYAMTPGKNGGTNIRDCSGNKVNYRGTDYVTSAAHCFVGSLNSDNAGLLGPRQGNTRALDFINNFQQVQIKDMSQLVDGKGYVAPKPMATATGVSIGLRKSDDSLIAVKAGRAIFGDVPSRSFDQVAALPYKPAINRPELGQQVAIYDAPAPDDIGKTAVGRYLGRMDYSPVRNQNLDMVAVAAPSLSKDPCEPGGSGSTVLLADGHQLGGLSFGLELYTKSYERTGTGYFFDASQSWADIESTLGVEIPPAFNEICMYGVRDSHSLPNLVGGLGLYPAD